MSRRVSIDEQFARLDALRERYPRLWFAGGPIQGRGLEASRRVILGLPSTRRMLAAVREQFIT